MKNKPRNTEEYIPAVRGVKIDNADVDVDVYLSVPNSLRRMVAASAIAFIGLGIVVVLTLALCVWI